MNKKKDFKTGLIAEMKRNGAYDVRIADPRKGFEHALPGRHPLELMADCKSVIVFALPRNDLFNHIYIGPLLPEKQPPIELSDFDSILETDEPDMYRPFKIVNLLAGFIAVRAINYLTYHGCKAVYDRKENYDQKGNDDRRESGGPIPCKLSAYEAGLSVYGKAGFTIHPELGNKMVLGAILTDAELEADPKLENFDPCADCEDLCVRVCPARAYGEGLNGPYHGVWDVKKCRPMREKLKNSCSSFCSLCWDICPTGKYSHDELGVMGIGDLGVFERVENWLDETRKRSPALSEIKKSFECIQKAAGVKLEPELLDKLYAKPKS